MQSKGRIKGCLFDFTSRKTLLQLELDGNYASEELKGDLDISIEPHSEKRSHSANSLYWSMVGQLSRASGTPTEKIYKSHIKDISNYQVLTMMTDAVEPFTRIWNSNHLGRFVETRESDIEGQTIVLAYYGSSDFNRKDMSHLIDNCLQDCETYGIRPKPNEHIEKLLEEWEKRHG